MRKKKRARSDAALIGYSVTQEELLAVINDVFRSDLDCRTSPFFTEKQEYEIIREIWNKQTKGK